MIHTAFHGRHREYIETSTIVPMVDERVCVSHHARTRSFFSYDVRNEDAHIHGVTTVDDTMCAQSVVRVELFRVPFDVLVLRGALVEEGACRGYVTLPHGEFCLCVEDLVVGWIS